MLKALKTNNGLNIKLLVVLFILLSFSDLTALKGIANMPEKGIMQDGVKLAGTTWKGVAKGTMSMEVRMTLEFVNGTDANMCYDVLNTASGQEKIVQKDVKGTLKYTFDGKSKGSMQLKHIDLFGGAEAKRPMTFTYNSNGTIKLDCWLFEGIVDNSIELKNINANTTANTGNKTNNSPQKTVVSKEPEKKPENKNDMSDIEEVFQVVQEMPSYPGGEAKMMAFISKNLQYPKIARETGIQGRVYVRCVIEPDGSVTNAEVSRGIGGGCDEEAIRIVQSMPNWNPGKQRGKAVRVSYLIPVVFKIQ